MPWHRWAEIWHRSAQGEFSGVFPENFKCLVGSPTSQLWPASHWFTPIWHRYKLGLHLPRSLIECNGINIGKIARSRVIFPPSFPGSVAIRQWPLTPVSAQRIYGVIS